MPRAGTAPRARLRYSTRPLGKRVSGPSAPGARRPPADSRGRGTVQLGAV
jgi:hypothetical protein